MHKSEVIKVINEKFKGKAVRGVHCSYLTKCGKRCAIGMFIPDDHPGLTYQKGVVSLLQDYPDLKEHMPHVSDVRLGSFHSLEGDATLGEQRAILIKHVEKFWEN